MDRNLGATRASTGYGKGTGLFYQWGRKDPFPATGDPDEGDFTAVGSDATVGTIDYTIKNPTIFITNNGNWLYRGHDNTLWGDNSTKTVYDPCPEGWRVPSFNNDGEITDEDSPWYGFTNSNGGTWSYGYTWGISASYPAAGYRLGSSGGLYNQSNIGFYWGASIKNNSSAGLAFYSGYVNVSIDFDRADGISVRCVKE
jgi:hypothetical protein